MSQDLPQRRIDVRGFKWPRRPRYTSPVYVLGEDDYGRWLGAAQGDPWWSIDGSESGIFLAPVVKVVPDGTFWTACFQPIDPVVDVDIVLPVHWTEDTLEEIDLELDVVQSPDGHIRVRDRDEFEHVRARWPMPDEIVTRAEETCERIRALMEQGAEPFATVGQSWLAHFQEAYP